MEFDSILDGLKSFLGDYGAPIAIGSQALGTLLTKKAIDAKNQQAADLSRQRFEIQTRAAQERQRLMDEQIQRTVAAQKERQAADQAARVAQQARIDAERLRQQQFREQAEAVNASVLPKFTPQAQEAAREGIAARVAEYISPTAAANEASYVTGGPTAPAEIKDRMEKTLAQSLAKGKEYAKAMAGMNSYGMAGQANQITMADARRDIGAVGTDARRSASILPSELAGEREKGALADRELGRRMDEDATRTNTSVQRLNNQAAFDEGTVVNNAISRGVPKNVRNFSLGADLANGVGQLSWLGAITRKKPATDAVASMWKAPTAANW